MKKVKLTVSAVIFATSSTFLGLGWIDSAQWVTLTEWILAAFLGTHAATDIAHKFGKNGS